MGTLQSELVEKGLSDARTCEVEMKSTGTSVKSKELLSDRDWAELMGTNRSTHRRVKGRVKQR